jgi:3-methylfumaryl-CoA hydratase
MEDMNAMIDFSDWVGRTQTQRQRIDLLAVAALAATLDLDAAPHAGAPLPPGWQWLFFNPVARQSTLGEDGHPRRDLPGSFLPPIPLPRRMWAGSRIRYLAPLPVGAEAARISRILNIVPKEGRAGRMCFVTVEHTLAVDGRDCIVEDQDIVFREASPPSAAPAAELLPAEAAPVQWEEGLVPGTLLLFRYSALTFNGHRIHYDQPYARDVEGYRDLVVHGPLTATLLQQFAQA